jgi:hypothetical protein
MKSDIERKIPPFEEVKRDIIRYWGSEYRVYEEAGFPYTKRDYESTKKKLMGLAEDPIVYRAVCWMDHWDDFIAGK